MESELRNGLLDKFTPEELGTILGTAVAKGVKKMESENRSLIDDPQYKFFLADIKNEEDIQEMFAKERSAILICGSQLGECYLCAELNRMLIADARFKFRDKPFFKQQAKKFFGVAEKKNIIHANQFSDNVDVMFAREFADQVTFSLYEDINKLKYSIQLELQHNKIPYAEDLAFIEVIRIIADIALNHYNATMERMKDFYPIANYNSFYCHVKQDDFLYSWDEFRKLVTDRYVPEDSRIDLNNNQNISNGVKVLINKIMSIDFCKKNEAKALEEVGDNSDKSAVIAAFNKFGIEAR